MGDIIALEDLHRDLLENLDVRQLFIEQKASATVFKNFRQYYAGCRCGYGCKCFFLREEFVTDMTLLAQYRLLLESRDSIDNVFAELIKLLKDTVQEYNLSRTNKMPEFKAQVSQVKKIQESENLDIEAAYNRYVARHQTIQPSIR